MASNTVTDRSCPPCTHDSHSTHTQSGARVSVHQWVCTHKHLHPHVGGHTQVHTCTHPHRMGCMQVCTHTRLPVGCTLTHHMGVHLTHKLAHTPYQCGYTQPHTCTPGSALHMCAMQDAPPLTPQDACAHPRPPPSSHARRKAIGPPVKTLVFPLPLGYF